MGACYGIPREKIIPENLLLDHPIPLNLNDNNQITRQMKKCVCKISSELGNGKSSSGTGFFCLIKFPKDRMMRTLITCHHNLVAKDSSIVAKSFDYSIGNTDFFKRIKNE